MKDYKINGKVIDITLDNGKIVKCSTEWVEKTMKNLETDIDDVLLMFLEDNDYLVNEEQDDLDKKAKGIVKSVVKSEKVEKKTQKERTKKENPLKKKIIQKIFDLFVQDDDILNLTIENETKVITFSLENKDFKIDLIEKRKKNGD